MNIGNTLISLGLTVVLLGLALKYAPWLVNWFGKLPGDIRIQTESNFIFIPITSMLVVSLVLSLIANFFFKK